MGSPSALPWLHPPGLLPMLTKEMGVKANGLTLSLQASLHLENSSPSYWGYPQPYWRKIWPWETGRTARDSPRLRWGKGE